MVKKILIISQEKNLARFTSMELQKADFLVDLVDDGQTALKVLKERDYDLILLDFFLADMSGQAFAEQLGQFKPASVLITMVSQAEVQAELEQVYQFAVSHIVKPFVVGHLIDIITRIFRGRDFIDQHCSQLRVPTAYRDLRIDTQNHTVFRGNEPIILTRREYDLLATLMGSGQVLTRDQLIERVWKYEQAAETNIVDVYIRYLRGKIDLPGQPSYIQTVRGIGYAMRG